MNTAIRVFAESGTVVGQNPWPEVVLALATLAFMAWLAWLFLRN